ncbi:MAG TPA: DUF1007 family protein [Spirochaetota bacterium]|nr:DUF1007 family protein [Spirochaetota bacterium]
MFIKKIIFFLIFIILSRFLYSHPHLFIKTSVEAVISEGVAKGIKINWEWDKWWSEDVINQCDKDGNGIFSDSEIKLIYDDFFIGIKDFNFFTELFVNDKKIKISKVLQFSADVKKDKLVSYNFIIPTDEKIGEILKIKIGFNDETIYTSFDKNIFLKKDKNFNYSGVSLNEKGYYGAEIIFNLSKK